MDQESQHAYTTLLDGIWHVAPPRIDARFVVHHPEADAAQHEIWSTTRGRLCIEMYNGGTLERVLLAQYDKREYWCLHPQLSEYERIERTERFIYHASTVGQETINGVTTQHLRGTCSDPPPAIYELEVWLAPDSLPAKVAFSVHQDRHGTALPKDKFYRYKTWTMSQVERGPQAKAVFELPRDYSPLGWGDKPIFNVGALAKNTVIRSGRIKA